MAGVDVFDEKNRMTATRDVVITVKNVEEDGTVTLSAQQPKVGVMLRPASPTDNVVTSSVTWKWERDNNRENDWLTRVTPLRRRH